MFMKIFKLCNHHLDILTWMYVNIFIGNSYDSNDKILISIRFSPDQCEKVGRCEDSKHK